MVLVIRNSRMTWSLSIICLTTETTYSVSDSVNSIGDVDRNTLPSVANSGILYSSVATSSVAGLDVCIAVLALWAEAAGPISSTTGKVVIFNASPSSSRPCATLNLFKAHPSRENDMENGSSNKLTSVVFCGEHLCEAKLLQSMISAEELSFAVVESTATRSSPRRRRASVARSRTSSSSSRRERRNSTDTEARSVGSCAANLVSAVTAAALTTAFSRITLL
mmetsp:Transcript_29621/g.100702  ORF Transcript_29621/g.100702 Transcript_29621/m.100702 type:complete len:222 (+) Transcript_29621:955-1620(+)